MQPERLAPEVALALAGELIGCPISIARAPGVRPLPMAGEIIDESRETFVVRLPGKSRARRIPKSGLEATVLVEGREIPLKGDAVRVRPEERTKRLAVRLRRRDR